MAIQVTINKQPLYGSVYWDGYNFIYTPNEGFAGTDYYIYTLVDGSVIKTLTNYVNTTNLPPSANNISLTASVDTIVTIDPSLYASDTDGKVLPLKVIELTPTIFGRAYIDDNIIKYQSNGYNNIERFYYTVSDGQYNSTGLITIKSINGSDSQIPDSVFQRLSVSEMNMDYLASLSSGWTTSYTILNTKSASWNQIDTSRYNEVSLIVETNSANWNAVGIRKPDYDAATTILNTYSGDWELTRSNINYITNEFFAYSAFWDLAVTVLSANSGIWNDNVINVNNLKSIFSANSGNWNNTYTTVQLNSSSWDKTFVLSIISANSSKWDNSYNTTNSNSAAWDQNVSDLYSLSSSFSTNSGNWENAFTTVKNNSAEWDKTIIITLLTSYSADWNSTYTTVSSNSSVWNDNVQNTNLLLTSYAAGSGDWENTYNTVYSQSSYWDKTLTISLLSANSANWDSNYITVSINSGAWTDAGNTFINIITAYQSNSGTWTDSFTVVNNNSANWDTTDLTNTLSNNSGNWETSYTILNQNSSVWNDTSINVTNLITAYNSASANWESTLNTVNSNSANWNIPTSVLSTSSANWNNTFTTVNVYSAEWNDVSTTVHLYSADWNNTFNTVYSTSADWDGTNTVVRSNSAKWLSGSSDVDFFANNLTVYGNVVIYGSVTAQGETTESYINFIPTSSLNITNVGTVDAMTVTKTQTAGALGIFYTNNDPVLYIGTNNKVGINTSLPNEALTVFGNISATGIIYGTTPTEYTVYQNNSAFYENAYTYIQTNSSTINNLLSSKSSYDQGYTYLNGISSNLNLFLNLSTPYYNSAYNVIASQSANNQTNYSFVTANSANIGTDYLFRSNKPNYDNAYNYVFTNSASWISNNPVFNSLSATSLSVGQIDLTNAILTTFNTPVTASESFLSININGENRLLQLWNA